MTDLLTDRNLESQRENELRTYVQAAFDRYGVAVAKTNRDICANSEIDWYANPGCGGSVFNACGGWLDLYSMAAVHESQSIRDQSRVIHEFIRAMMAGIRKYQQKHDLPIIYTQADFEEESFRENRKHPQAQNIPEFFIAGLKLSTVPHEVCKHLASKHHAIMHDLAQARRPER